MAKAGLKSALLLTAILALCSGFGNAQTAPVPDLPLSTILDRMQEAVSQAGTAAPYQITREYRLFGNDESHPSSDVTAEVDYLPPSEKSYAIQKREGSSRGEDVVRKILQHETEISTRKHWSGGAIDSSNYTIEYLGPATRDGHPCYLLGLDPKRKDVELIRGTAWVDARSFLIRHIEGQLVRNPSWMLKRVDVALDFAEVDGVWVQSAMEAVAEVRFIGKQTLTAQTVDMHVGDLLAKNAATDSHPRKHRRNLPSAVIMPIEPNR